MFGIHSKRAWRYMKRNIDSKLTNRYVSMKRQEYSMRQCRWQNRTDNELGRHPVRVWKTNILCPGIASETILHFKSPEGGAWADTLASNHKKAGIEQRWNGRPS